MKLPTTVLLPGLDGTSDLFAPFVAAAPSRYALQPLRLPDEGPQGYAELAQWVHARLPSGSVVLVAESFSGPLAILVAAQCARVVGVVLSTTFVEPPLSPLLSMLPRVIPRSAWRRPPPELFLRMFLTGGDPALAAMVRRALLGVPGDVVTERVAAVLRVSVNAEFEALRCPALCLEATRDRLLGTRSAARMRELRPDIEHVRIDAPHLLLQARPREAWSYVAPFVEREG